MTRKTSQQTGRRGAALHGLVVGGCKTVIWGMSGEERARRALLRAGCATVSFDVSRIDAGARVLAQRADMVVEERLLNALAGSPNTVLVDASEDRLPAAVHADPGRAPAAAAYLADEGARGGDGKKSGFEFRKPPELAGRHDRSLRKRADPLVLRLSARTARAVERETFYASYKGITDLITKFVWPEPALMVTRALAPLGVTPNMVTFASFIFTVLAFWFFWQGAFAAGLACAWAMAFLDTVDGKLARVTLTSSKWGDWFDHGIDLAAPPLWWLAWWVGLGAAQSGAEPVTVWIVLGGHVAGKLLEQAFISTFGLKVHVWQPSDARFRLITARRNPNLVILSVAVLAGAPAAGYVAMAAWIMISFVVHLMRYARALAARSAGHEIASWLDRNGR